MALKYCGWTMTAPWRCTPCPRAHPKEQLAHRLASPTPLDNRISYGCINVSAEFYQSVVSPAFTGTRGIVYVLPETRSLSEVFSLPDDDKRARGPLADPTFAVQQPGVTELNS